MKKKMVVVLLFLIALYMPSIIKYIHIQYSIHERNRIKDTVKSVDLSDIKIEGDVPGKGFVMTQKNVFINGKRVTSVDESINALGHSYSTGIEKFSFYYDTYTFIDHTNKLELDMAEIYKDNSFPYIVLKSIDRTYEDKYTSVNLQPDNYFGYAWTCFSIASYPGLLFISDKFITTSSLIYMPMVYFILFIPTMVAILSKKFRKLSITFQIILFFIVFIAGPFIVISQQ